MTALHWTIRKAAEISPVLALALLLIAPTLLSHEVGDNAAVLARNAEVVRAVEAAPYRIDGWVGRDVTVPTAAIEILRPNAILSRQYRPLEEAPGAERRAVNLVVVHCSDARDMQGHFPPICYPANGWTLPEGRQEDRTLRTPSGETTLRVYEFVRRDGIGGEERLRVFNYFLLPDGTTTSDLAAVNRLASRYALSIQGVAQIQATMSGDVSLDDSIHAVEELLSGTESLLNVLGQGGRDDYVEVDDE